MKHQAVISTAQGSKLTVAERDTPEPGPNEILIEAKAFAMNPVDWYQRDFGMPPVLAYPAVFGSDVAGIVAKVGSEVKNGPQTGARVMAMASSYYHQGSADHGAFQKFTLAGYECVAPIPDSLSFEEAAMFPLGALTALSAYTTMGISLNTKFTPEDKQAILIWGASSSVGVMAVQSAKAMGFTVYATAGEQNLEYMKELGADAAFDYKASDVVSRIMDKAKVDRATLQHAHMVISGGLQPILDVFKHTLGDGPGKIAHVPVLPADHETMEGVEIRFTHPPAEEDARNKHLYECFNSFLKKALVSGEIVPAPRMKLIPGGLEGVNDALDALKGGVSATKVVVSV